jgi:predicted transcriptional regulator
MDTMRATFDFLEDWKKLEDFIETNSRGSGEREFRRRLEHVAVTNPLIRINKTEILQIYEIRNVIAHEDSDKYYAYPNEYTANKLNVLVERIQQPKTVLDVVNNKPIVFQPGDSLLEVLSTIKKTQISQFPVYDGKVCKHTISTNGISLWLSAHVEEDGSFIKDLSNVTVADVLAYHERHDDPRFIHRQTTVEEFGALIEEHENTRLWIVTESGKSSERAIGVVSAYDIPEIMSEIVKL